MRIFQLLLVVSILVFIVGCTPTVLKPEPLVPVPRLTASDTVDIRVTTFNTCQSLIKNDTLFTGFVRYEECGKNCLGGCPNSGPQYCYYAIQDNYNCTVYVKSRIDAGNDERFMPSNRLFHQYAPDTVVTLAGNISMYTSYYCDIDERNSSRKSPACMYLVMEE